jgi:diguanylate cyclase (GGDEF)-like protein
MSVRTIHEIAAVLLGCLSGYVALIHLSTPALRGVRWVAIAYCSAAIGILLRQQSHSNLTTILGNLLITFLAIAFYWGISQLLQRKRLNLWLLLFLVPVLAEQLYFLYLDPRPVPRAVFFNAISALQSLCIVVLLLRNGTRETRLPRIGLASLFFYWGSLQTFLSFSGTIHNRVLPLAYARQVDGRFLLLPLLPAVLVCVSFLWLAMTQLQHELEHQSNTDVLTGLLNRRALQRAAARAIALAERNGAPLTLVLLDLDHFKQINDRHGHEGGDAALALTAQCLIKNLRAEDIIARIGGEEFVALLPETDQPEATLIAERIRCGIESLSMTHLRREVALSASCGVTRLQPGDTTLEQLLSRADQALYQAKKHGRNRVHTRWA